MRMHIFAFLGCWIALHLLSPNPASNTNLKADTAERPHLGPKRPDRRPVGTPNGCCQFTCSGGGSPSAPFSPPPRKRQLLENAPFH